MKHIFIINPKAGKIDRVKEFEEKLKEFDGQIDYEIYATKARGDARNFVNEYLNSHEPNETYRFYAIGGDGTLHDVANGAYSHENAEVACFASGSGNDFVKYFGDGPEFRDLKSLINGKPKEIDLIKVNDKVCINIISLGFDGEVTFAMHRFKRWPLVTGKMAYNLAAVNCLLFKMNTYFKVVADGDTMIDGKGLLIAMGNGHTYGGGFHCCPEAVVDDGLIDVCLTRKISRLRDSSVMNVYKRGEHIHNEKVKDIIDYRKCKELVLDAPKDVAYQIDGETFRTKHLEVKILPHSLKFVIPAKMEN